MKKDEGKRQNYNRNDNNNHNNNNANKNPRNQFLGNLYNTNKNSQIASINPDPISEGFSQLFHIKI